MAPSCQRHGCKKKPSTIMILNGGGWLIRKNGLFFSKTAQTDINVTSLQAARDSSRKIFYRLLTELITLRQ